jgi:ureidoglycolate hydrolase
MDRKILDVIEFAGEGYRPLIDCNGWRVAYLRYLDDLHPARITYMERHMQTDEVFVLLGGEAILFVGGGDKAVSKVESVRMEPCKLYNFKKSAWHGVVLSRDATILLVENTNTAPENTEYFPLVPEIRSVYLRESKKIKDWQDLKEE